MFPPLHGTAPTARPLPLRELSLAEHDRLERLFDAVIDACRPGCTAALPACWSDLDRALNAHMALEEREVIPAFAIAHPAEAEGLLREHEMIRHDLLELGVAVDLHLISPALAGRFIAHLRGHAMREDALLYRWVRERGAITPAP